MSEPIRPKEELEFKFPKLWNFHGHLQYETINAITKAKTVSTRSKNVGVVAISFDRAFQRAREQFPTFRISHVSMTDYNVDIVDDPLPYKVAAVLED